MLAAAVIGAIVAGVPAGCAAEPATTSSLSAPVATGQSTAVSTTVAQGQSTTTSEDPLSNRIEYAASLGGTSHKGDTLFFVVGANVATKEEAQSALEAALPVFGDMQSYFIVQWSSNFDGMEPGQWVVIEAYRENPSAENVEFGQRAFPNAYVVRATVKTTEPIPVYEDRLGL
jgi:hypothetical protein